MAILKIKSGDTALQFTDTLRVDGVASDITGATVLFLMKLIGSPSTAYSLAATIVSAASGTVKYVPGVGFPTAVGDYRQEWQVSYVEGTILTFPSDSYNIVKKLDDLN